MAASKADKPLGLIAGSGALPVKLAEAQADNVFVVALKGKVCFYVPADASSFSMDIQLSGPPVKTMRMICA